MTTLDERRIAPGATTRRPAPPTPPDADVTWTAPQKPGLRIVCLDEQGRDFTPYWAKFLEVELSALLQLPRGWDGFRALPITETAVNSLVSVLANVMAIDQIRPQIFPLADGGLSAEWRAGGDDAEVEVEPDGSVWVAAHVAGQVVVDDEISASLADDQSRHAVETLADVVKRLTSLAFDAL